MAIPLDHPVVKEYDQAPNRDQRNSMCSGKFLVAKRSRVHFLWLFNQDAVLAAEAGVDGIIISNHGGEPCLFFTVTIHS